MARYELSCGIREVPLKMLVYGVEGIGKSTLAAEMPSPVWIDAEGGTNQLPVARLPRPTSWAMLLDEVRAVRDGEVPCSTLVVDTADAAETLCSRALCAEKAWKSIESLGYGKGYTYLSEAFGRFLDLLSEVVERGRNVCVVAHAYIRKVERPDESGAYDRFELKLTKKVAPMAKEWADMVLFCDYKTYVEKDKNGRYKASGGARVIRTTHDPCWDAKNRFVLPDELPMILGDLPPELDAVVPDMVGKAASSPTAAPAAERSAEQGPSEGITAEQATATEPKAPTEVDTALSRMETDVARGKAMTAPAAGGTAIYERPGYPSRMSALADLMERDRVTDAELRHAVGQTGNFPESCLATDYEQEFVDYLVSGWDRMLRRVEANRVEANRADIPF